ncbi:MAG TPA: glycosyltransferase [bacterium]|nr:glycosyltransferase [bacterium]HPQ66552.1 glycosyltransferase [bacterium]
MNSSARRPRVTVVTPIYNNARMISDCLESLLPQDYPDYEVIVVDDGSTDGTAEEVRKHPVRLIVNRHLGISAARNAAIRAAEGEIIVLVDSDLKVPKDLLSRLVEPLTADPRRGVVMAWWDISNPDNLVASLIYRGYEYFTRGLDEPNFFWGYCFAIKKEVLDRAGFFDENLPLVEDVDYAYRVVALGYTIKILREVKVWHYFRDSLGKHLSRHFKTARHKFLYVRRTGRYTDQRGTGAEYAKIVVHSALVLSLATLPWTPWIFCVLLAAALGSHLRMTVWSMSKGLKFALMLPFEFLTKMAWVFGIAQGGFWLLRGHNPSPRDL